MSTQTSKRSSVYMPIPGIADFPRNAWYVAALSSEVVERAMLSRTLCGEPVVLYRDDDGNPFALRDMCPHRSLPLSKGKLLPGGQIRCGYHGFEFGSDGVCTKMTTPGRIPSALRARSFPVREVWNWIWIWPGDPALADPALIPDHDGLKLTSEGWNSSADFAKHWPGNYLLQVENSSDNLHLNFIHEGLVDDGLIGSILPSVEQNGHVVITTAEIPNTSGVELEKWWGFQIDPDCTRDRKVVTETHCPSVGHFKWTVVPHTADSRGDPQTMAATLAITPETDNSHWVFYASSINFEPRVAPDGESHIETLQKVLTQDVDCFVAIQDVVDKFGTVGTDISVPSDERALRARRVIGRMLAAEQGESSVKERAAQGEGRLTPVQR